MKVRYSFFVTSMLLGMGIGSAHALLVWLGVSFVAVLLHELGHALTARAFGQTPEIELHGFGGSTSSAWGGESKWYERVIICLSGPAIGFFVGGLVHLGQTLAAAPLPHLLAHATRYFLWVTLGWGAFNLFPLLPMDGGLVMVELLAHRMGADRGLLLARKLSCVTSGVGLVVALLLGQPWAALLCGIFGFDNYQRMRGLPGVALPR